MTTNITYTKYTNHKEPLSKQYWLEEDAIQKQASALLYDGSAERITMPFASFAHALKEATSNHAFGYGTYADNYPDKVSIVVNGKEQPDKHILARTTQHIAYTKEAVIMFDYDPSPYGKEMTQQAFIDALTSIHPEIKKAARIIRGSVSAGVYKINEQPSNNKKGFHVYLPVKDGSDIERYGRVLFNKLWLNGHGFIALASNGAMLNRSIIDGAVFSPERLDFVGNPVIKGEGLNYKSIDPVYVMGDYLDTSTLKDLTNDEKIQLDLLINNAKQEIKPLADKTQKTWKNNKVELMVKAGVSEKEAINTINKIFDSSNQNLCGKYLIEFANWVTVTVDDILKDPTTYDNQACADPIEGVGYGKTTAKFYWNNGKPAIHSLAHGQSLTYFLNSSQAESTFNEILDTEITYSHVDLLKYVDDNHKLKAISLQIAAEAHLPVNTVFIAGLSVYSSMLARKYVVNYENNYPLPIGIYSVLEQPSGTGKTRCLDTFQRPFYEIQKRLRKQASENLKPLIDLEEKGEKLTDEQTEEKDLLLKALKNLKEALFVTNSTPEALEKTLNNTLGFFSAISSEQGLFNSLLGNSYKSQGNSNNNDVMLNGFDGGYVNSIRVTRDGFNGKVVGAVCCFAQSGSIENVLNASNGTGVSERFLMLAEPHNLGKRDHTRKIQRDPFIEVNYANSCEIVSSVIAEPLNMDDLNTLKISANGFLKINQYRNKIEPDLADGGRFSHTSLRGAASKINMQIMKIAANLHLIQEGDYQPDIKDEYVDVAIHVANDLLEANLNACKSKGIMGLKAEYQAIITYLSNRDGKKTERSLINSLRNTQPFKDFSGDKSKQIKTTLNEMVKERLLRIVYIENVMGYALAQ